MHNCEYETPLGICAFYIKPIKDIGALIRISNECAYGDLTLDEAAGELNNLKRPIRPCANCPHNPNNRSRAPRPRLA